MSRRIAAVAFSALIVSVAPAELLYGIDDTSLYRVDTDTGQATLVGALNPNPPGLLGGLDWANGVLYGLAGTPGNALWRVDPHTAECTLIGPLNAGGVYEGGLAWDGAKMWAVNVGVLGGLKNLAYVDLQTGQATVVGSLGDTDFNGLAVHNGQLYGINSRVGTNQNNALWLIDRQNPTASHQIGNSFSFSLGVKGGMANEYGYADGGPFQFFKVNFDTGAATPLAQTTVRFRSLAPIPSNALVGDLNCDGTVDFQDINPFVLALSDPAGYAAAYPNCNILNGDVNGDGRVDFNDINPFVELLSGN